MDIEVNKRYERNEDMSPDGKLCLFMQPDGDIIVSVIGTSYKGEYTTSTIEFCTSGGRSIHTRLALRDLMVAIEKDNNDTPLDIDWEPYKESVVMTLQQIVIKYLTDNGFDGVFSDECGCLVDNFAPCGSDCLLTCTPGYKHEPGEEDLDGFDFYIRAEKP